ncbi:hypothetical protein ABTY00_36160 [Streptomyces microflavus]|uniref:hypothetical protein n=1 Tax=Streptomyces microflavus TaxID=1919 RepID=UPI00332AA974
MLATQTTAAAQKCEVASVTNLGLGTQHFPEATVVGTEAGEGRAMRLHEGVAHRTPAASSSSSWSPVAAAGAWTARKRA